MVASVQNRLNIVFRRLRPVFSIVSAQVELSVAVSMLKNEAGAIIFDIASFGHCGRKRPRSPEHRFQTLETCFLAASAQVELSVAALMSQDEAGAIVFDIASASHCGRKRPRSPERGLRRLRPVFWELPRKVNYP